MRKRVLIKSHERRWWVTSSDQQCYFTLMLARIDSWSILTEAYRYGSSGFTQWNILSASWHSSHHLLSSSTLSKSFSVRCLFFQLSHPSFQTISTWYYSNPTVSTSVIRFQAWQAQFPPIDVRNTVRLIGDTLAQDLGSAPVIDL